MKVSDFAVLVSKKEGKKKEVNIAQIKEILKVVNDLLGGTLYVSIRNLGKKKLNFWQRCFEWMMNLLRSGVKDVESN